MDDKIQEKLQALFIEYTKNLPHKIQDIESHWASLKKEWNTNKFKDFHREVHSLSGSAGTYGYNAISKSARKFEIYLKALLTNDKKFSAEQEKEITALLDALKTTALTVVGDGESITTKKESANHLVYFIEQDESFIRELNEQFKESGYEAQRMKDMQELKAAIAKRIPAAVLVDVAYLDEEDHKDSLTEFQKQHQTNIPIFCLADNNDILTRLKALRAGSSAFFLKPVDVFYLVKTLDQICGFAPSDPYRIIIVDDSESLAEYYSLILKQAGMITTTVTDPLLLMSTLEEFQPDLLLMDLYMPQCTGFELASLIRQETTYTRIPIIFLSTEDDKFKQLSALSAGGDDFLTKPILPEHLISAVQSRAKRAGILSTYIMRDSLTGLLNHTNILQKLDIEFSRANRQKTPLAFVMIDIDHFKLINDNYGHQVGDKVIRRLSNLLQSRLRKIDSVGRYGGEEFAVILPNTTVQEAINICNQLREQFAKIEFTANDIKFNVTISIGVASYQGLENVINLVSDADQALYEAKDKGRNRVICLETETLK